MASGGIVVSPMSLLRLSNVRADGGCMYQWDDGDAGVPRTEDGRVLESIGRHNWTSYQRRPRWAPAYSESAETSFHLPVGSEALYLLSRGSYQSGKVEVKQAVEERGDVRVDVRVAYHDARALARATVCRLRKSGDRHGVGIYVCFFPLCVLILSDGPI